MGRVCAVPGCPDIAVDKRHCEKHQSRPRQRRPKTKRPSAHKRGYGHRWQQERAQFLYENPWCVMCERLGKDVRATCVDHIEPHKGDQVKFWTKSNWQPLCAHHHNRKTATEDRRLYTTRRAD